MEISVNLKNPAQFFAAAGLAKLLELPSRFHVEEYEGEPIARAAFIVPDFDLQAMLKSVNAATFTEHTEVDGTAYWYDDDYCRPVLINVAGMTIELNWWLNEFWTDKSRLKMWGGTMAAVSMLKRLAKIIDADATDILNYGVSAPPGNRPTWGFDPRVTRNTGVAGRLAKVRIYPITELLCAVGLQCCRPLVGMNEITFCAWRDELPVELAMAAGELECVRSLTLIARREKRSKGMFNCSAAEFVENLGLFRTSGTFANFGNW